jgi:HD-GYP domain-containing protein (c-di-GMP phosphodiesterase class II)
MASLLAIHGLATQGFILTSANGIGIFTGGLTLPIGGALLALCVVRLPSWLNSTRALVRLQVALLVAIAATGAIALTFPALIPAVPKAGSSPALLLLGASLPIFALLAWRALRTFLLTRRGLDLVVFAGVVWLATSLVASLTTSYLELGWWVGHGIELDGILLVGIPVAIDLAQSAQSRPLVGDIHAVELVSSEEVFLGAQVRALTVSLGRRDEYTEQHTRRVAHRAVQVGERLGLSPRRLRALAIGGLVHDIGKLSIADSILKKPGPLDDEEYRTIQRHAEWGYRLLEEIGGFSDTVRRLVRDHHERLDGAGYPNGLQGREIDLDTRILTVCDVYDALISPRVYRPAWSHDQAMALLRSEAGIAYDARCVDALEDVLRAEGAETECDNASTTVTTDLFPSLMEGVTR